ncbi:unnamed protein product [Thelazia callipaeda]|uniref:SynN domain-containing protein n=1 Tax=Thelazia callipaeda TaxID=103827 RepID=A0A0N5CSJ1_THECL|nr:unnamed protein product [Thelazia callipaeda]
MFMSHYADYHCRLRDVCRALQETQERVAVQRKEVETILEEEKEFRELAEQVQCAGVQLKALRDDIEKIKCRIMTCRMKLIHLNDEKFKKGLKIFYYEYLE